MPTDVRRRLRRQVVTGLRRTGVRRVSRQHFGERDRSRRQFGRLEHTEERAGETTAEGCRHVVRVALDHEGIVLDAVLRQLQVAERVPEQDARDDGSGRRAHSSTKGYLVVDLDRDMGGREGQAVREEDVEGDAGDQVLVRVERGVSGALTGVREGDFALGFRARRERDAEGEVAREGETEDIKARSDVGRRRRDSDRPLRATTTIISALAIEERKRGGGRSRGAVRLSELRETWLRELDRGRRKQSGCACADSQLVTSVCPDGDGSDPRRGSEQAEPNGSERAGTGTSLQSATLLAIACCTSQRTGFASCASLRSPQPR